MQLRRRSILSFLRRWKSKFEQRDERISNDWRPNWETASQQITKALSRPSEKAIETRRLCSKRPKQLYVRALGNTWFCHTWEHFWQNFNFNCTIILKTSCIKTTSRWLWNIHQNCWSRPNYIQGGGITNSVNFPSLVTAPHFPWSLEFDPRSACMWRRRFWAIKRTKLRDTFGLWHSWLDSSLC